MLPRGGRLLSRAGSRGETTKRPERSTKMRRASRAAIGRHMPAAAPCVQLLYRPLGLGRWVTRFARCARLVHTRRPMGIDLWSERAPRRTPRRRRACVAAPFTPPGSTPIAVAACRLAAKQRPARARCYMDTTHEFRARASALEHTLPGGRIQLRLRHNPLSV